MGTRSSFHNRECRVCSSISKYPIDSTITIIPCSHQFCRRCTRKQIRSQIKSQCVEIQCPYTSCCTVLTDRVVHHLLDKEHWTRYQRQRQRAAEDAKLGIHHSSNRELYRPPQRQRKWKMSSLFDRGRLIDSVAFYRRVYIKQNPLRTAARILNAILAVLWGNNDRIRNHHGFFCRNELRLVLDIEIKPRLFSSGIVHFVFI